MGDVATPHVTRPNPVLITEPITTTNRGEIARWLEDRGIQVGVPPLVLDEPGSVVLLVTLRDGIVSANEGDRIVFAHGEADVLDHAHYKLWYEPAAGSPDERTEP